jgi:hypothetical protein
MIEYIRYQQFHHPPIIMNQTRDALIVCITQYTDLPMPPEIAALAKGAEEMAKTLKTNKRGLSRQTLACD